MRWGEKERERKKSDGEREKDHHLLSQILSKNFHIYEKCLNLF